MCIDVKVMDDQKIRISGLWDTLKRYDSYISTVNFKSGLIASFNTAVFAGVILKTEEITKLSVKLHSATALLLSLISLLSILSIFWVIRSIWPNLKSASLGNSKNQQPSLFFFASVSKNFTAENYAETLRTSTVDALEKDLAIQVHEVASLTLIKFRRIARAGWMTILNLICLIILGLALTIDLGALPWAL